MRHLLLQFISCILLLSMFHSARTQVCCFSDSIAPVMQGILPPYELSCSTSPTTASDLEFTDDCGLFGVFYDSDAVPISTEQIGNVFPILDTMDTWKGNLSLWSDVGIENYVYLPGTAQLYLTPSGGHLEGELVQIDDNTRVFEMHLFLENRSTWPEWHAQNTIGNPVVPREARVNWLLAQDLFEDWQYFEISDSSFLIGRDALEGSFLQLTHAPSNRFFGFQLGPGATGYNSEAFGFESWGLVEGEIDGMPLIGFGDVNGMVDLLDYVAPDSTSFNTATWTAVDECMNLSQVEQTLIVLSGEDQSDSTVHFVDVPGSLEIECSDNWPQTIPLAYSACQWIDVENADSLIVDFCNEGIHERIFIAVGLDGIAYYETQVLFIEPDVIAPNLLSSYPQDITLVCGTNDIPAPPDLDFEDLCQTDLNIVFSETGEGESCDSVITRTWSVSDACANGLLVEQQIDFEEVISSVMDVSLDNYLNLIYQEDEIQVIVAPELAGKRIDMTIYDALGKKIRSIDNVYQIDLTTIPEGLFIVQIEIGGRIFSERFIKY